MPITDTKRIVPIVACVLLIAVCYGIYDKFFYYYKPYDIPEYESIKPKTNFPTFNDKIWLHRCNSIERMTYYLSKYNGFETDAYYNTPEDYFNIDHDNVDRNTRLEDIFVLLTDHGKPYLWIDFKNLSETTCDGALRKLETLCRKYAFPKDRLVVESPHIELLNKFANAGFPTSFYFHMPSGDIVTQLDSMRMRFIRSKVHAVSSDLRDAYCVERVFKGVPHLYWDMKSLNTQPLTFIAAQLRRSWLMSRDSVAVLLVREKHLLLD
jgi:hypothetical protein